MVVEATSRAKRRPCKSPPARNSTLFSLAASRLAGEFSLPDFPGDRGVFVHLDDHRHRNVHRQPERRSHIPGKLKCRTRPDDEGNSHDREAHAAARRASVSFFEFEMATRATSREQSERMHLKSDATLGADKPFVKISNHPHVSFALLIDRNCPESTSTIPPGARRESRSQAPRGQVAGLCSTRIELRDD